MKTASVRTASSENPLIQRAIVTVGCALLTGLWAEVLLLAAGG